ncbi:MAG TPA: hypothetical protein VFG68_03760 [Fimbriiglobus sp.]|nr:hypothetical protein [Fimbriiglobus sp.]
MSSDRYQVSMSRKVAEEIEVLFEDAARHGVTDDALAAYQTALDQLETNPMGYGEARENLPAMSVRTRIAFERPLVIRFGVHESGRIVWLQSVRLRLPRRR